MINAESTLPQSLLERATLRGQEFAWLLHDIPKVIEAAKAVNLVNVGGQLQFRFADGGTCECDWVCVDTLVKVAENLPWEQQVNITATEALIQFSALSEKYDFMAEGKLVFGKYFREIRATDADLENAMCFVWYVSGDGVEPN